MSREIVRSLLALDDLRELARYIRQQNHDAALRFLDAAEATFQQLASLPGLGERLETSNPLFSNLRRCLVGHFPNHIIYYQSTDDAIVVVRVLHAARDADRIFGEKVGPEGETAADR